MKLFIVFILVTSSIACASENNCSSPQTQSEMNYCAGSKLDKVELNLKRQISKLSKILGMKDSVNLLLGSNKIWFQYRDSHCKSVTNMYQGGSAHSFMEAECKSMLTFRRIKSLLNDYRETISVIKNGAP